MTPGDGVLRVSGRIARALAFLVIEKVTAKRNEVMQRQFLLQEIDHRIFGSSAALLSRQAVYGIGAFFRRNTTSKSGYVALIHVPGLGRHMYRFRECVIPGGIVLLQIVVRVLAVVDPVGANVNIVIDRRGGIAHATGA